MTDRILLGGDDEPAHLDGGGPVPAPLARRMLAEADNATAVSVRRLFTRPATGELAAMESSAGSSKGNLRRFLIIRDQSCRTPGATPPIRHGDHPVPVQAGGSTSAATGQGLCEACNHTKEAYGWRSRPDPIRGAGDWVTITTPTGHTYLSRPPDPPGGAAPGPAPAAAASAVLALLPDEPSKFERLWHEVVLAA